MKPGSGASIGLAMMVWAGLVGAASGAAPAGAAAPARPDRGYSFDY